jgi:hypothetical protein
MPFKVMISKNRDLEFLIRRRYLMRYPDLKKILTKLSMFQKVIQKIEDFCFFMLDHFIYRNTQNNRYNVIVEDCTFAIFFPTEFALFLLTCHIIQKSKKCVIVIIVGHQNGSGKRQKNYQQITGNHIYRNLSKCFL